MNKPIIIGAISVGSLMVVIALGWSIYVCLTRKPAVDVSLLNNATTTTGIPKPIVIALPTPSTTSIKLETTLGTPDEGAMNTYWLLKINELRQHEKLEPIIFDTRLAHTAKIWAVHMGTVGILSHDRPNGEKVSEWIKTYNLPFMTRGTNGGYRNTFTENIGRAYADTSMKSLEAGLDQVLTSMVDEGPEGDHYKTIFSPNWNRYGGGFYFEPITKDRVRVYMAFHYGSLQ